MTLRIALATCREYAGLDPDDRLLLEPLRSLGAEGVAAVWDDPAVDWASFDAVVLRSTWDYPERLAAFLAWASRVPLLFNSPEIVRWNTDKRYLHDLEGDGIAVVPTAFAAPGEHVAIDTGWREVVVKPSASAGSRETARYRSGDERVASHVARLHRGGRTAMLQLYHDGVDSHGETALLYVAGHFSHGVRKGPLLAPDGTITDGLFAPEDISPRAPSDDERRLADRVMEAVRRRFGTPLYARVDLLPGPMVLEVELTEPSMFLACRPGAADAFAGAIVAAVHAAHRKAR